MGKAILKLDPHEVDTTAWKKLSAHYERDLADKRRELENPRASDTERTRLCWQIDMIKRFLSHSDQDQKNVAGAGESPPPAV